MKVPSIFGGTTEEGAKDMGTQFINSTADVDAFLKNRFPGLTNESLDALGRMYLGGNGSWPVFASGEWIWLVLLLVSSRWFVSGVSLFHSITFAF